MSKPISTQRAFSLYREALQRGNLDTVAAILWLAERDSALLDLINKFHQSHEILASAVDIVPLQTGNPTESLTIPKPSPNGLPPKTVYQEEAKIMNIAIPNPNRRMQPYPRMLSAVAAVLLLFVFGAVMVTMLALPTGNNFGQIIQLTQEPLKAGCQLTTTAAASDESLRLAQAANDVLEADEPDNELAMLLSICALQTAYSQEADDALQQAMVTANLVPEFPIYSGSYQAAQLSPDGHYLLTADSMDGAHLWDVTTGSEVRNFPKGHSFSSAPSVAFSADSKYALTTIEPGIARLWEIETGAVVRDFDAGIPIGAMAISPDGTLIALGGNRQVQLWDTATGTLLETLITEPNPNSAHWTGYVMFSPDGNSLLVSVGSPYSIQLWDVETRTKIRDFLGIRDPLSAIFSPDGRYVIAGGRLNDARAILWDAESGAEIHTFTEFLGTHHVQAFAFTPDGRYVLMGSANRTARLYEVETGIEVRAFNNNPSYINTVDLAPDGKRLLIAIGSSTARLWSTDYRDTIADACRGISRDFTPEEREQYGIRGGAPTCPQFAESYALEPGMTPMPTQPIPVWTPLPTLQSTGG